jgi:formyl-CoA transferase
LANGVWSAACIASAGFAGGSFESYREVRQKRNFAGTIYQCADDRWIQLTMVRSEEELVRFFDLLGLPTLFEDERFSTPEALALHLEDLTLITEAELIKRSSDEWIKLCSEAGLNLVRIGTIEELMDDEMVYANKIVEPPADPNSKVPYIINHPINVDALQKVGATKAPDLGEHTDDILAEMGLATAQIAELRSRGIIQ